VAFGGLGLPKPALAGAHQVENAGIAMMALQCAGFEFPEAVLAEGMRKVEWPARLQRLSGRLAGLLPEGSELWLDGAHNPGGAEVLAAQLKAWGGETILILGMKQSKDVAEFIRILAPYAARVFAVAENGQHLALPVEKIVAASAGVAELGPDVSSALGKISAPSRVLICGSLYLAGEVLKMDAGGG
jgi:dihydrofolate synthase/folylpolyglutamate synthase